MRVLILGAGGQVGRAMAACAPPEAVVTAMARRQLDLADLAAVRRVVSEQAPDICINCAAYVAVDQAESEPALAHRINAEAVGVIAEAVDASRGRLVQISSDFVFDGLAARAYRPCDRINPLSAYGRSKAAGERAAGDGALIVRTSWVHGAGGVNFVTTMLRLLATRSELRVVDDQIGTPTWTTGLAEAIWAMLAQQLKGTWHWSDAGVASWYDFALAIAEEAAEVGLLEKVIPILPIPTSDYPTPAKRPPVSLLDSRETVQALQRAPMHWRVNLRRHLRSIRAAPA